MIILGIDPGIADTGFGVIRKEANGKLVCLEYGSIRTKAGVEMSTRLMELSQGLDEIMRKYEPAVMAIEELFFCNNVKTALIVGQARGVALLTARQNNIKIKEFTPLQVKQAVSSYGKADKGQVQRMVQMLLNLKEIPRPDDAADALAVAMCGSNI